MLCHIGLEIPRAMSKPSSIYELQKKYKGDKGERVAKGKPRSWSVGELVRFGENEDRADVDFRFIGRGRAQKIYRNEIFGKREWKVVLH